MIGPIKDANIGAGESAAQFTERAEQILAEAKELSEEISGNLTELNRWMAISSPTMTGIEALYFLIECMRQRQNGAVLPEVGTVLT